MSFIACAGTINCIQRLSLVVGRRQSRWYAIAMKEDRFWRSYPLERWRKFRRSYHLEGRRKPFCKIGYKLFYSLFFKLIRKNSTPNMFSSYFEDAEQKVKGCADLVCTQKLCLYTSENIGHISLLLI